MNMKKAAALLTAFAAAFAALPASVQLAPQTAVLAADQVNIMPIGDSITFGYGEDGGYRKYLDCALKDKGISFDMVGPEGPDSGTFNYNGKSCQYDNNHAGYSGFTIKQQYPIPSWGENGLLEKLQSKNAVKQAQPDIVLLIIGTNDMTANRDLTACETDLHTLVDYILGDLPEDGVIFMGSIPEFTAYGGNAQRVANYNSTVKKVAESYGDNVRFADVHGCLNGMADMASDDLHPSGAGYEKMGKFWADTIEEYLGGASSEPGASEPELADGELLHTGFETGLSGWTGRGGASVSAVKAEAAAGDKSALVSDRSAAWNGISYDLGSLCAAGSSINVSAKILQKSGAAVKFKLSVQYGSGNSAEYDTFAEGSVASGDWTELSAQNYTVKSGSDPILYIETDTDSCDFYVDEIIISKGDGSSTVVTPPETNAKRGDADASGKVDQDDAALLRDYLSGKSVTIAAPAAADLDGDKQLTAKDLTLLKQIVLQPAEPEPEHMSGKEYMAIVRNQITTTVPAMGKAEGKLEHITYFSKKANRDKGANVWLPPGYDTSKQYPVFYVNHGYGGDEGSMTNGMGILEIATTLIKSGEAEPMIIVFTNQYTDPAHEKQTGNGQADVPGYDNFVEDMPDSLMPYIESHYPVKTGRENTAVSGFSMGGRESLYIGIKCCDKVGYIGAGAPAPGIFPTKDQFMDHPGVMSKDDMRIDAPYEPYMLMIAGGTSDGMVNDFPEQYSKLFTEHGTENIFIPVPGGGHDASTVTPLMYNFIRCLFKA